MGWIPPLWTFLVVCGLAGVAVVGYPVPVDRGCILRKNSGPHQRIGLTMLTDLFGEMLITESNEKIYYVSICRRIPLNGSTSLAGAVKFNSKGEYVVLGQIDQADIVVNEKTIVLTYIGGDVNTDLDNECRGKRWKTYLTFICDPYVIDDTLTLVDEDPDQPEICQIRFQIPTSKTCRRNSSVVVGVPIILNKYNNLPLIVSDSHINNTQHSYVINGVNSSHRLFFNESFDNRMYTNYTNLPNLTNGSFDMNRHDFYDGVKSINKLNSPNEITGRYENIQRDFSNYKPQLIENRRLIMENDTSKFIKNVFKEENSFQKDNVEIWRDTSQRINPFYNNQPVSVHTNNWSPKKGENWFYKMENEVVQKNKETQYYMEYVNKNRFNISHSNNNFSNNYYGHINSSTRIVDKWLQLYNETQIHGVNPNNGHERFNKNQASSNNFFMNILFNIKQLWNGLYKSKNQSDAKNGEQNNYEAQNSVPNNELLKNRYEQYSYYIKNYKNITRAQNANWYNYNQSIHQDSRYAINEPNYSSITQNNNSLPLLNINDTQNSQLYKYKMNTNMNAYQKINSKNAIYNSTLKKKNFSDYYNFSVPEKDNTYSNNYPNIKGFIPYYPSNTYKTNKLVYTDFENRREPRISGYYNTNQTDYWYKANDSKLHYDYFERGQNLTNLTYYEIESGREMKNINERPNYNFDNITTDNKLNYEKSMYPSKETRILNEDNNPRYNKTGKNSNNTQNIISNLNNTRNMSNSWPKNDHSISSQAYNSTIDNTTVKNKIQINSSSEAKNNGTPVNSKNDEKCTNQSNCSINNKGYENLNQSNASLNNNKYNKNSNHSDASIFNNSHDNSNQSNVDENNKQNSNQSVASMNNNSYLSPNESNASVNKNSFENSNQSDTSKIKNSYDNSNQSNVDENNNNYKQNSNQSIASMNNNSYLNPNQSNASVNTNSFENSNQSDTSKINNSYDNLNQSNVDENNKQNSNQSIASMNNNSYLNPNQSNASVNTNSFENSNQSDTSKIKNSYDNSNQSNVDENNNNYKQNSNQSIASMNNNSYLSPNQSISSLNKNNFVNTNQSDARINNNSYDNSNQSNADENNNYYNKNANQSNASMNNNKYTNSNKSGASIGNNGYDNSNQSNVDVNNYNHNKNSSGSTASINSKKNESNANQSNSSDYIDIKNITQPTISKNNNNSNQSIVDSSNTTSNVDTLKTKKTKDMVNNTSSIESVTDKSNTTAAFLIPKNKGNSQPTVSDTTLMHSNNSSNQSTNSTPISTSIQDKTRENTTNQTKLINSINGNNMSNNALVESKIKTNVNQNDATTEEDSNTAKVLSKTESNSENTQKKLDDKSDEQSTYMSFISKIIPKSVIFIIGSVAILPVAYFTIGTGINRFVRGMSGPDQIPHSQGIQNGISFIKGLLPKKSGYENLDASTKVNEKTPLLGPTNKEDTPNVERIYKQDERYQGYDENDDKKDQNDSNSKKEKRNKRLNSLPLDSNLPTSKQQKKKKKRKKRSVGSDSTSSDDNTQSGDVKVTTEKKIQDEKNQYLPNKSKPHGLHVGFGHGGLNIGLGDKNIYFGLFGIKCSKRTEHEKEEPPQTTKIDVIDKTTTIEVEKHTTTAANNIIAPGTSTQNVKNNDIQGSNPDKIYHYPVKESNYSEEKEVMVDKNDVKIKRPHHEGKIEEEITSVVSTVSTAVSGERDTTSGSSTTEQTEVTTDVSDESNIDKEKKKHVSTEGKPHGFHLGLGQRGLNIGLGDKKIDLGLSGIKVGEHTEQEEDEFFEVDKDGVKIKRPHHEGKIEEEITSVVSTVSTAVSGEQDTTSGSSTTEQTEVTTDVSDESNIDKEKKKHVSTEGKPHGFHLGLGQSGLNIGLGDKKIDLGLSGIKVGEPTEQEEDEFFEVDKDGVKIKRPHHEGKISEESTSVVSTVSTAVSGERDTASGLPTTEQTEVTTDVSDESNIHKDKKQHSSTGSKPHGFHLGLGHGNLNIGLGDKKIDLGLSGIKVGEHTEQEEDEFFEVDKDGVKIKRPHHEGKIEEEITSVVSTVSTAVSSERDTTSGLSTTEQTEVTTDVSDESNIDKEKKKHVSTEGKPHGFHLGLGQRGLNIGLGDKKIDLGLSGIKVGEHTEQEEDEFFEVDKDGVKIKRPHHEGKIEEEITSVVSTVSTAVSSERDTTSGLSTTEQTEVTTDVSDESNIDKEKKKHVSTEGKPHGFHLGLGQRGLNIGLGDKKIDLGLSGIKVGEHTEQEEDEFFEVDKDGVKIKRPHHEGKISEESTSVVSTVSTAVSGERDTTSGLSTTEQTEVTTDVSDESNIDKDKKKHSSTGSKPHGFHLGLGQRGLNIGLGDKKIDLGLSGIKVGEPTEQEEDEFFEVDKDGVKIKRPHDEENTEEDNITEVSTVSTAVPAKQLTTVGLWATEKSTDTTDVSNESNIDIEKKKQGSTGSQPPGFHIALGQRGLNIGLGDKKIDFGLSGIKVGKNAEQEEDKDVVKIKRPHDEGKIEEIITSEVSTVSTVVPGKRDTTTHSSTSDQSKVTTDVLNESNIDKEKKKHVSTEGKPHGFHLGLGQRDSNIGLADKKFDLGLSGIKVSENTEQEEDEFFEVDKYGVKIIRPHDEGKIEEIITSEVSTVSTVVPGKRDTTTHSSTSDQSKVTTDVLNESNIDKEKKKHVSTEGRPHGFHLGLGQRDSNIGLADKKFDLGLSGIKVSENTEQEEDEFFEVDKDGVKIKRPHHEGKIEEEITSVVSTVSTAVSSERDTTSGLSTTEQTEVTTDVSDESNIDKEKKKHVSTEGKPHGFHLGLGQRGLNIGLGDKKIDLGLSGIKVGEHTEQEEDEFFEVDKDGVKIKRPHHEGKIEEEITSVVSTVSTAVSSERDTTSGLSTTEQTEVTTDVSDESNIDKEKKKHVSTEGKPHGFHLGLGQRGLNIGLGDKKIDLGLSGIKVGEHTEQEEDEFFEVDKDGVKIKRPHHEGKISEESTSVVSTVSTAVSGERDTTSGLSTTEQTEVTTDVSDESNIDKDKKKHSSTGSKPHGFHLGLGQRGLNIGLGDKKIDLGLSGIKVGEPTEQEEDEFFEVDKDGVKIKRPHDEENTEEDNITEVSTVSTAVPAKQLTTVGLWATEKSTDTTDVSNESNIDIEKKKQGSTGSQPPGFHIALGQRGLNIGLGDKKIDFGLSGIKVGKNAEQEEDKDVVKIKRPHDEGKIEEIITSEVSTVSTVVPGKRDTTTHSSTSDQSKVTTDVLNESNIDKEKKKHVSTEGKPHGFHLGLGQRDSNIGLADKKFDLGLSGIKVSENTEQEEDEFFEVDKYGVKIIRPHDEGKIEEIITSEVSTVSTVVPGKRDTTTHSSTSDQSKVTTDVLNESNIDKEKKKHVSTEGRPHGFHLGLGQRDSNIGLADKKFDLGLSGIKVSENTEQEEDEFFEVDKDGVKIKRPHHEGKIEEEITSVVSTVSTAVSSERDTTSGLSTTEQTEVTTDVSDESNIDKEKKKHVSTEGKPHGFHLGLGQRGLNIGLGDKKIDLGLSGIKVGERTEQEEDEFFEVDKDGVKIKRPHHEGKIEEEITSVVSTVSTAVSSERDTTSGSSTTEQTEVTTDVSDESNIHKDKKKHSSTGSKPHGFHLGLGHGNLNIGLGDKKIDLGLSGIKVGEHTEQEEDEFFEVDKDGVKIKRPHHEGKIEEEITSVVSTVSTAVSGERDTTSGLSTTEQTEVTTDVSDESNIHKDKKKHSSTGSKPHGFHLGLGHGNLNIGIRDKKIDLGLSGIKVGEHTEQEEDEFFEVDKDGVKIKRPHHEGKISEESTSVVSTVSTAVSGERYTTSGLSTTEQTEVTTDVSDESNIDKDKKKHSSTGSKPHGFHLGLGQRGFNIGLGDKKIDLGLSGIKVGEHTEQEEDEFFEVDKDGVKIKRPHHEGKIEEEITSVVSTVSTAVSGERDTTSGLSTTEQTEVTTDVSDESNIHKDKKKHSSTGSKPHGFHLGLGHGNLNIGIGDKKIDLGLSGIKVGEHTEQEEDEFFEVEKDGVKIKRPHHEGKIEEEITSVVSTVSTAVSSERDTTSGLSTTEQTEVTTDVSDESNIDKEKKKHVSTEGKPYGFHLGLGQRGLNIGLGDKKIDLGLSGIKVGEPTEQEEDEFFEVDKDGVKIKRPHHEGKISEESTSVVSTVSTAVSGERDTASGLPTTEQTEVTTDVSDESNIHKDKKKHSSTGSKPHGFHLGLGQRGLNIGLGDKKIDLGLSGIKVGEHTEQEEDEFFEVDKDGVKIKRPHHGGKIEEEITSVVSTVSTAVSGERDTTSGLSTTEQTEVTTDVSDESNIHKDKKKHSSTGSKPHGFHLGLGHGNLNIGLGDKKIDLGLSGIKVGERTEQEEDEFFEVDKDGVKIKRPHHEGKIEEEITSVVSTVSTADSGERDTTSGSSTTEQTEVTTDVSDESNIHKDKKKHSSTGSKPHGFHLGLGHGNLNIGIRDKKIDLGLSGIKVGEHTEQEEDEFFEVDKDGVKIKRPHHEGKISEESTSVVSTVSTAVSGERYTTSGLSTTEQTEVTTDVSDESNIDKDKKKHSSTGSKPHGFHLGLGQRGFNIGLGDKKIDLGLSGIKVGEHTEQEEDEFFEVDKDGVKIKRPHHEGKIEEEITSVVSTVSTAVSGERDTTSGLSTTEQTEVTTDVSDESNIHKDKKKHSSTGSKPHGFHLGLGHGNLNIGIGDKKIDLGLSGIKVGEHTEQEEDEFFEVEKDGVKIKRPHHEGKIEEEITSVVSTVSTAVSSERDTTSGLSTTEQTEVTTDVSDESNIDKEKKKHVSTEGKPYGFHLGLGQRGLNIGLGDKKIDLGLSGIKVGEPTEQEEDEFFEVDKDGVKIKRPHHEGKISEESTSVVSTVSTAVSGERDTASGLPTTEQTEVTTDVSDESNIHKDKKKHSSTGSKPHGFHLGLGQRGLNIGLGDKKIDLGLSGIKVGEHTEQEEDEFFEVDKDGVKIKRPHHGGKIEEEITSVVSTVSTAVSGERDTTSGLSTTEQTEVTTDVSDESNIHKDKKKHSSTGSKPHGFHLGLGHGNLNIGLGDKKIDLGLSGIKVGERTEQEEDEFFEVDKDGVKIKRPHHEGKIEEEITSVVSTVSTADSGERDTTSGSSTTEQTEVTTDVSDESNIHKDKKKHSSTGSKPHGFHLGLGHGNLNIGLGDKKIDLGLSGIKVGERTEQEEDEFFEVDKDGVKIKRPHHEGKIEEEITSVVSTVSTAVSGERDTTSGLSTTEQTEVTTDVSDESNIDKDKKKHSSTGSKPHGFHLGLGQRGLNIGLGDKKIDLGLSGIKVGEHTEQEEEEFFEVDKDGVKIKRPHHEGKIEEEITSVVSTVSTAVSGERDTASGLSTTEQTEVTTDVSDESNIHKDKKKHSSTGSKPHGFHLGLGHGNLNIGLGDKKIDLGLSGIKVGEHTEQEEDEFFEVDKDGVKIKRPHHEGKISEESTSVVSTVSTAVSGERDTTSGLSTTEQTEVTTDVSDESNIDKEKKKHVSTEGKPHGFHLGLGQRGLNIGLGDKKIDLSLSGIKVGEHTEQEEDEFFEVDKDGVKIKRPHHEGKIEEEITSVVSTVLTAVSSERDTTSGLSTTEQTEVTTDVSDESNIDKEKKKHVSTEGKPHGFHLGLGQRGLNIGLGDKKIDLGLSGIKVGEHTEQEKDEFFEVDKDGVKIKRPHHEGKIEEEITSVVSTVSTAVSGERDTTSGLSTTEQTEVTTDVSDESNIHKDKKKHSSTGSKPHGFHLGLGHGNLNIGIGDKKIDLGLSGIKVGEHTEQEEDEFFEVDKDGVKIKRPHHEGKIEEEITSVVSTVSTAVSSERDTTSGLSTTEQTEVTTDVSDESNIDKEKKKHVSTEGKPHGFHLGLGQRGLNIGLGDKKIDLGLSGIKVGEHTEQEEDEFFEVDKDGVKIKRPHHEGKIEEEITSVVSTVSTAVSSERDTTSGLSTTEQTEVTTDVSDESNIHKDKKKHSSTGSKPHGFHLGLGHGNLNIGLGDKKIDLGLSGIKVGEHTEQEEDEFFEVDKDGVKIKRPHHEGKISEESTSVVSTVSTAVSGERDTTSGSSTTEQTEVTTDVSDESNIHKDKKKHSSTGSKPHGFQLGLGHGNLNIGLGDKKIDLGLSGIKVGKHTEQEENEFFEVDKDGVKIKRPHHEEKISEELTSVVSTVSTAVSGERDTASGLPTTEQTEVTTDVSDESNIHKDKKKHSSTGSKPHGFHLGLGHGNLNIGLGDKKIDLGLSGIKVGERTEKEEDEFFEVDKDGVKIKRPHHEGKIEEEITSVVSTVSTAVSSERDTTSGLSTTEQTEVTTDMSDESNIHKDKKKHSSTGSKPHGFHLGLGHGNLNIGLGDKKIDLGLSGIKVGKHTEQEENEFFEVDKDGVKIKRPHHEEKISEELTSVVSTVSTAVSGERDTASGLPTTEQTEVTTDVSDESNIHKDKKKHSSTGSKPHGFHLGLGHGNLNIGLGDMKIDLGLSGIKVGERTEKEEDEFFEVDKDGVKIKRPHHEGKISEESTSVVSTVSTAVSGERDTASGLPTTEQTEVTTDVSDESNIHKDKKKHSSTGSKPHGFHLGLGHGNLNIGLGDKKIDLGLSGIKVGERTEKEEDEFFEVDKDGVKIKRPHHEEKISEELTSVVSTVSTAVSGERDTTSGLSTTEQTEVTTDMSDESNIHKDKKKHSSTGSKPHGFHLGLGHGNLNIGLGDKKIDLGLSGIKVGERTEQEEDEFFEVDKDGVKIKRPHHEGKIEEEITSVVSTVSTAVSGERDTTSGLSTTEQTEVTTDVSGESNIHKDKKKHSSTGSKPHGFHLGLGHGNLNIGLGDKKIDLGLSGIKVGEHTEQEEDEFFEVDKDGVKIKRPHHEEKISEELTSVVSTVSTAVSGERDTASGLPTTEQTEVTTDVSDESNIHKDKKKHSSTGSKPHGFHLGLGHGNLNIGLGDKKIDLGLSGIKVGERTEKEEDEFFEVDKDGVKIKRPHHEGKISEESTSVVSTVSTAVSGERDTASGLPTTEQTEVTTDVSDESNIHKDKKKHSSTGSKPHGFHLGLGHGNLNIGLGDKKIDLGLSGIKVGKHTEQEENEFFEVDKDGVKIKRPHHEGKIEEELTSVVSTVSTAVSGERDTTSGLSTTEQTEVTTDVSDESNIHKEKKKHVSTEGKPHGFHLGLGQRGLNIGLGDKKIDLGLSGIKVGERTEQEEDEFFEVDKDGVKIKRLHHEGKISEEITSVVSTVSTAVSGERDTTSGSSATVKSEDIYYMASDNEEEDTFYDADNQDNISYVDGMSSELDFEYGSRRTLGESGSLESNESISEQTKRKKLSLPNLKLFKRSKSYLKESTATEHTSASGSKSVSPGTLKKSFSFKSLGKFRSKSSVENPHYHYSKELLAGFIEHERAAAQTPDVDLDLSGEGSYHKSDKKVKKKKLKKMLNLFDSH